MFITLKRNVILTLLRERERQRESEGEKEREALLYPVHAVNTLFDVYT